MGSSVSIVNTERRHKVHFVIDTQLLFQLDRYCSLTYVPGFIMAKKKMTLPIAIFSF